MVTVPRCIRLAPQVLGLLFCVTFSGLMAQERFTISGNVKDVRDGEDLIGVSIFIKTDEVAGTASNVYGFYSLTIGAGTHKLNFRYVGYSTVIREVVLDKNIILDVDLTKAQTTLQEVVVTSDLEDSNVSSVESGISTLGIQKIRSIPSFLGEVEVLRALQFLPGVSVVGEGGLGFNVRGGKVGQNLVLQDEAPVYQSSHLFGFFSVFNPDAVKELKLYKGGVPARYGGRLSSILDIRLKEGNNKSYNGRLGIGTIFSRIAIEGPIVKEKASFIVAARRSYLDWIINTVSPNTLPDGSAFYFYDATIKANARFGENNRVYVSGYLGRDVLKFAENQGFSWGNQTATARWNHLFSQRLFSNYTFVFSDYNYAFEFGENKDDRFEWRSRIRTFDFKPELTWFISDSHELSYGGEVLLYDFKPATAFGVSDGEKQDVSLQSRTGLELAAFVENQHDVSSNFTARYGLRLSQYHLIGTDFTYYTYQDEIPGFRRPVAEEFKTEGSEIISTYLNLEPRLSLQYTISEQESVKATYNRMSQYIHLISNTTTATPIDVWASSSNNLKPQIGHQVSLGYFRNFLSNQIETSVEGFYKWNRNQVDYIAGADLLLNSHLEADLLSGDGRAYGLELMVNRTQGYLRGSVSYTLSRSELKIDGINFGSDYQQRKGQWYPSRYDQTHNLKITGEYYLPGGSFFSTGFSFVTGTPTTYPSHRYIIQGFVVPLLNDERNTERIEPYHRLDLSYTIPELRKERKNKRRTSELIFSVYNLYSRKNPFSVSFGFKDTQGRGPAPGQGVETTGQKISIIGSFIPGISYNIKFE